MDSSTNLLLESLSSPSVPHHLRGLGKLSIASLLWNVLQDVFSEGSSQGSGTTGSLATFSDICQRLDGDNSFRGIYWGLKQKARRGQR